MGGSSSLPGGGSTWLGETPRLDEGHGVSGSGSVLWLWQRSQMSVHELPVLLCPISPQCPQLGVLRGVCYPLDEGRDEPQKDFNEAFRPGFEPRPSLPGPGLFPQCPQSECPPGPTPVLPHRCLHIHAALTLPHAGPDTKQVLESTHSPTPPAGPVTSSHSGSQFPHVNKSLGPLPPAGIRGL